MKYKIETFDGTEAREASSLQDALAICRNQSLEGRVYRGAQYVTDAYDKETDDRVTVNALDVWTSKRNATRQMDAPADFVISWK